MASTASAASDLPRPNDVVAQAIGLLPVWPSVTVASMGEEAARQSRLMDICNDHGDKLKRDLSQQAEMLVGKAGDADRESLTAMMKYAYDAADHFESKVATALGYQSLLVEIQSSLTLTHEAAYAEWQQTGGGGSGQMSMAALAAVAAKYGPDVISAQQDALDGLGRAPRPKPLPTYGGQKHDGTQALDNRTKRDGGQSEPPTDSRTASADNGGGAEKDADATQDTRTVSADNGPQKDIAGNHAGGDTSSTRDTRTVSADPGPDSGMAGDTPTVAAGPGVASIPFRPGSSSSGSSGGGMGSPASAASGLPGSLGSALSGGGAMGSPASAASGLGSAFSGGGLGSPTAAASALPGSSLPDMSSALSSGQSSFSPLANAGSSFQSGLASGLGSSGALQPMTPVQPAVSAVQSMATPVMPAGAPSEAAGLGAAGGPMMGGGGAVPPAAMAGGGGAAGALAPYTPAGSGAVPPAAAAATTAAAGSATAGSAGGGPVQQGAGGGGVPMVASAAGGAVGAVPEPDANADLVTARQVLEGLMRGSDGALEVPLYAVSVLRTPTGPQTVVASNVGGGSWLPAGVFLPWTARLATVDPTLPMGWAANFMGWPKPVDIVLAHCDEVSKTAAGVSISAIATSDPIASIPRWIDSATIGLRDIWATPGAAPILDGAHVHRLASINQLLSAQVEQLEGHGQRAVDAAYRLSYAIMASAQGENPIASISLVRQEEAATLAAVRTGGVDWDAYTTEVRSHCSHILLPVAPGDLDDGETTRTMRIMYAQWYRSGRMIELVRLWENGAPLLRDVAYCGVAAGFGSTVLSELQKLKEGAA